MDRISKKFKELKNRKEKAFIPFVVVGDPNYKISLEIVKVLAKYADLLELGL